MLLNFNSVSFQRVFLDVRKTDPSKCPKIGQKASVSRDFLGSDAWGRKKEAFRNPTKHVCIMDAKYVITGVPINQTFSNVSTSSTCRSWFTPSLQDALKHIPYIARSKTSTCLGDQNSIHFPPLI